MDGWNEEPKVQLEESVMQEKPGNKKKQTVKLFNCSVIMRIDSMLIFTEITLFWLIHIQTYNINLIPHLCLCSPVTLLYLYVSAEKKYYAFILVQTIILNSEH